MHMYSVNILTVFYIHILVHIHVHVHIYTREYHTTVVCVYKYFGGVV